MNSTNKRINVGSCLGSKATDWNVLTFKEDAEERGLVGTAILGAVADAPAP